MDKKNMPIGVIDSGLGGLSVLKVLLKELPNEDYIYFGDSKNAPYGTKSHDEIRDLTFNVVDKLRDNNIKALVTACNTMTTTVTDDLIKRYPDLLIVGIVPAIKEASQIANGGGVLVMATPATVKQKVVLDLIEENKDRADILKVGCKGLMEYVERMETSYDELKPYFDETIKPYIKDNLKVIVLGCTHYPFTSKALKQYVDELLPLNDVKLIDGSPKTLELLKKELENNDMLNDQKIHGSLTIMNSLNDDKIIETCFELLED